MLRVATDSDGEPGGGTLDATTKHARAGADAAAEGSQSDGIALIQDTTTTQGVDGGVGNTPQLPWYGDPVLLLPKFLYFIYCAANAAFIPYVVVFYDTLHFTPEQIGILAAGRPVMLMIFSPLWGCVREVYEACDCVHKLTCHMGWWRRFLSDKVFGPKKVMLLAVAAVGLLRTAYAIVPHISTPFPVLMVLCYCAEAFACASFPLLDVQVLALLGPEKRLSWGKTRLWGAVGWGIFAWVFGGLYDSTGLGTMWVLYPLTMAVTFASVARMPAVDTKVNREASAPTNTDAASAGDSGSGSSSRDVEMASATVEAKVPESSCGKLQRLLSQPAVLLFVGVVTTMGCLMGIISNFLFLRLDQLDAPNWLIGASLTVTCIAEVPLLHYSGDLIKRFGVMCVLAAALVCYGLRLQWYAHMTNPYWVLPVELLHGVTYGAGWAAGTCYAAEIAPAGLEGTMQGLLSSAHWGVGAALGSVVGGILYEELGAVHMFNVAGVVALFGLGLCAVAWREARARAAREAAGAPATKSVQWKDADGVTRRVEMAALRQDPDASAGDSDSDEVRL